MAVNKVVIVLQLLMMMTTMMVMMMMVMTMMTMTMMMVMMMMMVMVMMMMTGTSCKSSKPSTVSSVKVSHSSACFHLCWHDFEYNGDVTGTLDHYGDCRDD